MRTNCFTHEAEEAFRKFVSRPEFPCLGAKAALNSASETVRVFDELGSAESTHQLVAALSEFTNLVGRDAVEPNYGATSDPDGSTASCPTEYATFIAIFEKPRETNEREFENLLWKQLRLLHKHDAPQFDWDPSVSSDPADPHFSFSFGGQALYVIGLHANSSREARSFA